MKTKQTDQSFSIANILGSEVIEKKDDETKNVSHPDNVEGNTLVRL